MAQDFEKTKIRIDYFRNMCIDFETFFCLIENFRGLYLDMQQQCLMPKYCMHKSKLKLIGGKKNSLAVGYNYIHCNYTIFDDIITKLLDIIKYNVLLKIIHYKHFGIKYSYTFCIHTG